jgi:hypothetical protein
MVPVTARINLSPTAASTGGGSYPEGANAPSGVPELPDFDGVSTHGALVDSEGTVVARFSSGNADANQNSNLVAKGHVEVKAAYYMRENALTEFTVYHNNLNGTCNM